MVITFFIALLVTLVTVLKFLGYHISFGKKDDVEEI